MALTESQTKVIDIPVTRTARGLTSWFLVHHSVPGRSFTGSQSVRMNTSQLSIAGGVGVFSSKGGSCLGFFTFTMYPHHRVLMVLRVVIAKPPER
jgi:hypothetical protein